MNEDKQLKIAVLLSGGVDSCVAVHLLCQQGYRPDLYYIYIGADEDMTETSCASEDDILICRMMARRYHLNFEIVNLHQAYHTRVVGYMLAQVKRGFTPNSDVMCNRLVKFGCFDEKIGYRYDKIATGHYARIVERNGKSWLATNADMLKDQTDFLCRINLPMEHLMFPLGNLTKADVRRIAEEANLPSAKRADSQGICFLGKVNFTDFLKHHLGEKPGRLVEWETGKVIGQHQGYWFYTIGQRKGLSLSGGPWFVVKKDIEDNVVYISKGIDSEARFKYEFTIGDLMPLGGIDSLEVLNEQLISFKIRHIQHFTEGRFVYDAQTQTARICTTTGVHGVAPGQFCTLYDVQHEICWGSGEIAAMK